MAVGDNRTANDSSARFEGFGGFIPGYSISRGAQRRGTKAIARGVKQYQFPLSARQGYSSIIRIARGPHARRARRGFWITLFYLRRTQHARQPTRPLSK